MLLDRLASHEEFGWISRQYNILPKLSFLRFLNRIYDIPIIGDKLFFAKDRSIWNIHPVEPWSFFEQYLDNFRWERGGDIPPRRRTRKDITESEVSDIRNITQKICKSQNKDFFLSKYTNFSRMNYLTIPFPKAKFIHITRDGRAVANSYYKRIESGDFNTWEERDWWMDGWPSEWKKEFEEKYNSKIAFVTYQWKFFLREIWADKKNVSNDQYLEVRYEDTVENTKETFARILEFCGLELTDRVEKYLDYKELRNMNYKWKQNLTVNQKQQIDEIIHEEKYREYLEDLVLNWDLIGC